MAFSIKLTDALKEVQSITRADNAMMFAFILKNQGEDAQSFTANMTPEGMFCVLATVATSIEEAMGMSRKDIYKILEKTMKEAGPIKRTDIED